MKKLLLILNLLITIHLSAEDIHPSGKFLADSVKIGQPIKFFLSVSHLPGSQILFPDSGYSFSPFELIRKEYYPTVTRNNKSFDSAVYILRTFNLQPNLSLSLPVFMVSEGDSNTHYTEVDTVFLKEYLPEIPLTIDLREQAEFNPIEQNINYPYILAYAAIALVLALVFYFLFGKAINRRYKLFKVRSDHINFENNYKKLQKEFTETKGPLTIEQALSIWKAYLARLENKPINTYTSTEIINLYDKDELKNGLNVIDRAIYGGVISAEAEKALNTLRRFSNRQYHKRKKQIQNV